jgi:hypothetical protein
MRAKQWKARAIMIRSDKLSVAVYALHGDTCGLQDSYNHHDSLGCASGFASGDYVLVARFAYLQEAIDYCQLISKRGVNTQLVSRIVPTAPYISNYPKQAEMRS